MPPPPRPAATKPSADDSRDALSDLLREIRACRICGPDLPAGPRPVLQAHSAARILVAGQAPGSRVHETGVPFDDPSGDRLRRWMEIDRETFYDPKQIAILPMGFCYPGRGKSGDLPPRPECAEAWRVETLARLGNIQLTLLIGRHAMNWHLRGSESSHRSLTEIVKDRRTLGENIFPLPHPSPRNNPWLQKNPWFEQELQPELARQVRSALETAGPPGRFQANPPK